jgi:divalent metal cation (Fe/Co/Zn/Cd) transporter
MAAESKRAVVAAIIGNAAIAVIKFVAGSMTGSSAMISEGIHSLVGPPTPIIPSGTAWRSTSGASSSP